MISVRPVDDHLNPIAKGVVQVLMTWGQSARLREAGCESTSEAVLIDEIVEDPVSYHREGGQDLAQRVCPILGVNSFRIVPVDKTCANGCRSHELDRTLEHKWRMIFYRLRQLDNDVTEFEQLPCRVGWRTDPHPSRPGRAVVQLDRHSPGNIALVRTAGGLVCHTAIVAEPSALPLRTRERRVAGRAVVEGAATVPPPRATLLA